VFQGARFLEKVGGPGHHLQPALGSHGGLRLAVERQHHVVVPAHYQQGGGPHLLTTAAISPSSAEAHSAAAAPVLAPK
jgi:hypothetical protein